MPRWSVMGRRIEERRRRHVGIVPLVNRRAVGLQLMGLRRAAIIAERAQQRVGVALVAV